MARVASGLFLTVWVFALLGCFSERWLGFVYPDKSNLMSHKVIGEYKSLNECLNQAMKVAGDKGSYECGLNCEDKGGGLNVCDRTFGNEK